MAKLSQEKINSLRAELVALNKAYREGNPQISDVDYDHMVETLRVNSPEDEFFKKGIVEEATDRMEPLPVPMYSLEKIKTIKDFRKWLQKMFAAGCKEIVATPKFDGISLVVDEDDKRAWTRGDGVEGQLSTKHFDRMFNGEGEHPEPHLMHTWGEAIMKKKTFAHLKDNQADFAYKNARNMVAGIFNSPDGWNNRFMANVDFVRYGSDLTGDKSSVLEELKRTFHNVTPYVSFLIEEIMELDDEEMNLLLDEELHDRFDAEYKIDGVVTWRQAFNASAPVLPGFAAHRAFHLNAGDAGTQGAQQPFPGRRVLQKLLHADHQKTAVGLVQGTGLDQGEVGDQRAHFRLAFDAAEEVVGRGVVVKDKRRALKRGVVHKNVNVVLAGDSLKGGVSAGVLMQRRLAAFRRGRGRAMVFGDEVFVVL